MTDTHRFSRQRLAWIILSASFFTCMLLTVTVPIGVSALLQNATQALDVVVQANQGTVGIEGQNGPRRAVLAGEPAQPVGPQTSIWTDTTASALMTVMTPEGQQTLVTMQVAGNSTLQLDQAAAPRFGVSNRSFRVLVDLQAGRVRLDVPRFGSRPLELALTTPQGGRIDVIESGRYTLEVSNDVTQVTVVSDGHATVSSQGQTLVLEPGQRMEISPDSAPVGPFDPARDLIRNGDFSEGLDNWALFSWQVELPDQPKGETTVQPNGGDPVLRLTRQGVGHADVRLTQSVNQDVSDYEFLRLSATLRVVDQSLGVCGVQGSECPLFIIVNYVDDSGISRVWQHGFFANGTIDDNLTPGACISCAVVQRPHDRVPLGQLYFYDVDLIQELAIQGALPPRYVESVTLVGSGHSFTTEVSDVALIVE
ncbi:MAG: hypothetical protein KIS95_05620 [Anaerolineae bacterium]|uniref:hypothetical protein n=1 Tax=Promineifilum sp. TaxID=2664178 RepID=UPI001DADE94E|nr:hypothetical protein [Anaerolineales bacterium]MCB8934692.1 hypothetical protein [Promineifilum sp.]MCO5180950.1 hypothetical protein [Promineifilum sp.]MCW5846688.1 hypothetical protein [Anaerolineae bacterium]